MSLTPKPFNKMDVEILFDNVKSFMTTNLNVFLAAMNTAKNDGVTLAEINNSAYVVQAQRDRINYNPFVFIWESNTNHFGIGPATRKESEIEVFIVIAPLNETSDVVWRKLARYREVLIAMFEQGWDTYLKAKIKTDISALPQTAIKLEHETKLYVGTGIKLKVNYA